MNELTILPPAGDGTDEPTDCTAAFFAGLPPSIYKTVCDGLEAEELPMALVSDDLMVLRQTAACSVLLDDTSFYALEGVLEPAVCASVRMCLKNGTRDTVRVRPLGKPYQMHIYPVNKDSTLLIFRQEQASVAGVTMMTSRVREAAARLLMQADRLADSGLYAESGVIRKNALWVLREATHTELLLGAAMPMSRTTIYARTLLEDAEQQLTRRGISVQLVVPKDFMLYADGERLLSALMTLVSNSLHAGGMNTRIVLAAEQRENDCYFTVTDNGTGLQPEALDRLNTWSKTDALPGGWGLGLPYARSIAEEHGGRLLFETPQTGCRAILVLPNLPADGGLESGLNWNSFSVADTVDMELSDALTAEDYE